MTSGNNLVIHYTGATDATPATAYWIGDQSSVWSTNTAGDTNWATTAAGTTDTNAVPGSGSDVYFTANSASNLTNTLGQDFTINSLNFTGTGTSATSSVTISGNTLTLAGERRQWHHRGERLRRAHHQQRGRSRRGPDLDEQLHQHADRRAEGSAAASA